MRKAGRGRGRGREGRRRRAKVSLGSLLSFAFELLLLPTLLFASRQSSRHKTASSSYALEVQWQLEVDREEEKD